MFGRAYGPKELFLWNLLLSVKFKISAQSMNRNIEFEGDIVSQVSIDKTRLCCSQYPMKFMYNSKEQKEDGQRRQTEGGNIHIWASKQFWAIIDEKIFTEIGYGSTQQNRFVNVTDKDVG